MREKQVFVFVVTFPFPCEERGFWQVGFFIGLFLPLSQFLYLKMERDFMGLSSKEPLSMVKEEMIDDGRKDSGMFPFFILKNVLYQNLSP